MLNIEYHYYIPEELKPNTLYISEEFEVTIHICPCGCNGKVVIPIDEKYGWKLTKENELITLMPSLLNKWCKAHYHIINSEINWCK